MSKNLIIHIGLHKTGTTYLQYNFFPKLEDTIYIHGNRFFQQWTAQSEETRKFCLWSYEGFSGVGWNKQVLGLKKPDNAGYWLKSFETNIYNIKRYFPEATIVCVFRRPGDLCVSMYKQYIHEGGILSFNDFYSSEGVIGEQDLSVLARVNILEKQFDNCFFLNYEDYKKIGDEYFRDFFKTKFELRFNNNLEQNSVKSNRGVAGWKLKSLRWTNKYYRFLPSYLKKGLRRLRWSPRDIFQNKLNFISAVDDVSLENVRKEINTSFNEEWGVFERRYPFQSLIADDKHTNH